MNVLEVFAIIGLSAVGGMLFDIANACVFYVREKVKERKNKGGAK